jgi:16S rRNA (uracil1498-N3)-methyltransferase
MVTLSAAERRHLENVRRVRPGDEVCVLNGTGEMGEGGVREEGRVEIREVLETAAPCPELHLMMGAVKQSAWEEILRHATELGVARIVRVETDRAVARLGAKSDRKAARWRELLIEACKQSANPRLPKLALASSVAEAVADPQLPACGMVAQLTEEPLSPGEAFQTLGSTGPLAVWVGPEGDFTAEETAAIRAAGALPVSLGPCVLRAETAALSLLSRLRLHR